MSCVGPVCEISQGIEGGWVVIEASHMMGYGLNVTFNMLIICNSKIVTAKEFLTTTGYTHFKIEARTVSCKSFHCEMNDYIT